MLVEVKVQSLGLDRRSNSPVVILKELDGERVLPIWIGPGEASAIAMHLADMKFPRPLTHDLLVRVLGGLDGSVNHVVIHRVEDETYYADIVIHKGDEVISIDARPSDSIAVAIRVQARILAHESLLEDATIEISDSDQSEFGEGQSSRPSHTNAQAMGPKELKEYLSNLNPEDFGRFTP